MESAMVGNHLSGSAHAQDPCALAVKCDKISAATVTEGEKVCARFAALRKAVLAKNAARIQNILRVQACPPASAAPDMDEEERSLLLESNGKMMSTLDAEGLTVLHQAIFTKSITVLSALIEGGGDVNARDEEGCTLLHTAAMMGNCLIAGWLLKEGANATSTDAEGLLPIDRTEDCGMEDLLLSAMSLAGYAQHRAAFSCDFSEADDSDYGTGTSSLGSFSEDDGVLSLTSCTWEEDEESHGLQLQAERRDRPSDFPGSLRCPFAWRLSSDSEAALVRQTPSPVSSRGRSTAYIPTAPTPECKSVSPMDVPAQKYVYTVECDEAGHDLRCSTASNTETGDIASPSGSLAAGVRSLKKCATPSNNTSELHVSQPYRYDIICTPPTQLVQSRSVAFSLSSFAHALVEVDNKHSWSAAHRYAIMVGFQVVTKRHAELVQSTKAATRQQDTEPESPRQHGITRWATVSESDLGWILPRSSRPQIRSILRNRSLNDSSTSCSQATTLLPTLHPKRGVKFASHIVFQDSVRSGDVDEVKSLISSERIGINSLLPTGLLPLHLAVLNRQRTIAQFLLTNGAEVDGRDEDGWTPLHAAALEGTVPIANLLLEFQADPMATTVDGQTSLSLASNANVRLVLQNATRDAMNKVAKQRQAQQERPNLLDDVDDDVEDNDARDSDIFDESGDGTTSGEESDTEEDDVQPSLVIASRKSEKAIEAPAVGAAASELSPATAPRPGVSHTMTNVEHHDLAVHDTSSADANPTDDDKTRAACEENGLTTAKCTVMVIEGQLSHTPAVSREMRGEKVGPRRQSSKTKVVSFSPSILLRHAILNHNVTEVRSLLSDFDTSELGLNLAELSGVTALHQAVLEEASDLVELILADGRSDVNAKDTDGWTPLHAASAVGNESVVRLLLQHGALATMLNDEGKFPIELAERVEVEGLLRQAMHSDS